MQWVQFYHCNQSGSQHEDRSCQKVANTHTHTHAYKRSWQHQELMHDECLPYDAEEIKQICKQYGNLAYKPGYPKWRAVEQCLLMHQTSYDLIYKAQKYNQGCEIEGPPPNTTDWCEQSSSRYPGIDCNKMQTAYEVKDWGLRGVWPPSTAAMKAAKDSDTSVKDALCAHYACYKEIASRQDLKHHRVSCYHDFWKPEDDGKRERVRGALRRDGGEDRRQCEALLDGHDDE